MLVPRAFEMFTVTGIGRSPELGIPPTDGRKIRSFPRIGGLHTVTRLTFCVVQLEAAEV